MSETICLWRYQINIQVWKGDCGILFNAKLLTKVMGAARFKFCPQCGRQMVKEMTS
jgi:predicted  nucleic acid-binding Zn-ribbon protein